ncbi:2-hydroxychromene-2-carboxylate isomerase [Vineibacter terrae]|uniref:2-hydroxychromene-2-carboxylate isomerase n=1 Tax=Vineibacter terrae TaxID=2586908 RepID=A0A5C8PM42_9HYPH|nr:2-hydroxychromene-2-carboxylate isomerase [Vineibacter terrae]TXL75373.1 2-hydroxychromene-2-carboxylate isomerase [Vineibacter terrae]
MARQIEFYFDFPSPYSYLATTQFPALMSATGAEIVYRPFRILELMKMVGNRPTTIECKNKGKYAGLDIGRWAARYKVPFQRNPGLRSMDFAQLGRGALVAIEAGRGGDYVGAVYRALWAGDADIADRPALAAVLDRAGFDGEALLKQADAPDYVGRLDQATEAAAGRGVFGSPTFFVGDQMFFGNDRLDFVTDAAKAAV